MPQWGFLNFLEKHAKRYREFHLLMRTEGTELVRESNCVIGVTAADPDGPLNIRVGRVAEQDLHAVQRRRELPTRLTQSVQTVIQNRVISNVLRSERQIAPPWSVRMLGRFAPLRRIPARILGLGLGFRPEHVRV